MSAPRLWDMLRAKRPAWSDTEEDWIGQYIAPTGARPDTFGNYWLDVGDPGGTLFSAHTDTVHFEEGYQRLRRVGDWLLSHGPDCLGADDTTGCWLLLKLIDAGVPGRYVFHRAEELGCAGSEWVTMYNPDRLAGVQRAIAFDRAGPSSIITHQMGERTASRGFARALRKHLPGFLPDAGGVYTDSYSYRHDIPECTNLSVGYVGQHSMTEAQHVPFALQLAKRLVRVPWSSLPAFRKPPDGAPYGRGIAKRLVRVPWSSLPAFRKPPAAPPDGAPYGRGIGMANCAKSLLEQRLSGPSDS